MNLERYVNLGFAIAGILAWVIAARFFGYVIGLIDPELDKHILGSEFTRSDLLGLITGIAVGVGLKVNKRVNEWAMNVAYELSRVTWPKWDETKLSTVAVIVTSLIVAMILAFFDAVANAVTSLIYGIR